MNNVILASKSPRRKELLHQIIENFDIVVSNVEETIPNSLSNYQVPVYLARKKAKAVFKNNKDSLVIASDTIVVCQNQILGKPKNKEDLHRMISLLSDKTHVVITGVCVINKKKMVSFNSKTLVTFNKLTDKEIEEYLKLDTVYDKAGGYAIQGEAAKFIKEIKGDYYNVMGLPISKLYNKLKQF